jgi:hypothetical protein
VWPRAFQELQFEETRPSNSKTSFRDFRGFRLFRCFSLLIRQPVMRRGEIITDQDWNCQKRSEAGQ